MTKISAAVKIKRLLLVAIIATATYAQPYRVVVVQGHSMEPTYKSGEVLLARRFEPSHLRQGDVVVIDMPFGTIIKRVAWVSGQFHRLAVIGGVICEPFYGLGTHHKMLENARWLQSQVPDGTVYVLGDNQPVSVDSKTFGFVPISRIRGVLVDQRRPVPPPNTSNVPVVQEGNLSEVCSLGRVKRCHLEVDDGVLQGGRRRGGKVPLNSRAVMRLAGPRPD